MSLERISIFIEQLFQFCFERRGILWQPAPRHAQAANVEPLFQDIIGNAVLNTCIEFQQDVHEYSTVILNCVSNLIIPVNEHHRFISIRVFTVSEDILANENYASQTQATYVFLAVMVDVATQSARDGNHQLVNFLVHVVALILNGNMPYDFIQNFDIFLMYAFGHGQPPGN